jgi:hypothetical protein
LLAFHLSDDITMIHLARLFGWIGMPHAFQVLTRSLQALCSHIISGWCYWYVDDLMAVSPITTYVTDSAQVESTVQRLLGVGSECARALEFLGWFVDLDARTVTLCNRNLHKLLHALFSFDTLEKSPSLSYNASHRWHLEHHCSAGICDRTLMSCTSSQELIQYPTSGSNCLYWPSPTYSCGAATPYCL